MAIELENIKAYMPGLYDPDTGEACTTEKVVDVTEDCPSARNYRCIFLYGRTKRGRIIQMMRPYGDNEYVGLCSNFFVDELEREMHVPWLSRPDIFGLWAIELGLSKHALRSLIEAHAPAA